MKYIKSSAAAFAVMLVTLASPSLHAQGSPVVVELFTSQGCYSCPPAEAFLGELAERADIVALEFHVDYWDSLNYMWHGQWKDPFSSPEYTQRQRLYNVSIRGQSGVYTPQMVIDGRYEAVGSRRGQVETAIAKAFAERKLSVAVTPSGNRLSVLISGDAAGPGDVFLVKFIDRATTEVKKGENHGKVLVSRHIVRGMQKLGVWKGRKTKISLPKEAGKANNAGCAVIVQAPNHGPLLGAALCPNSSSS
ncbi:MAG: DUF1223 domain-containing protein [Rhodospirillales bacterium]